MFEGPANIGTMQSQLMERRDRLETKIRKAYHKKNMAVRRDAILHHQLMAYVQPFLEAYDADAQSKQTYQRLNELANLLVVCDLKQKDIAAINQSLLYATLNQLIAKSESSSLVELALQVDLRSIQTQSVLTGADNYGAYLDEVRDFCRPILNLFDQLSRKGKADAIWCLGNMLLHRQAGQLIRMLSDSQFIPEINHLFQLLILENEMEDKELFDSIVNFGMRYLCACQTIPTEPDESLANGLLQIGVWIFKRSLLSGVFNDQIEYLMEALLDWDMDIFDDDDELLELIMARVHEGPCGCLLVKIVETREQLRTTMFERLLTQLLIEEFKFSTIDNVLQILSCIMGESTNITLGFLVEVFEDKIKIDTLLALAQRFSCCDSFQSLTIHLVGNTTNKELYLPLLEQFDRRSVQQNLSSGLLKIIDDQLNGTFD